MPVVGATADLKRFALSPSSAQPERAPPPTPKQPPFLATPCCACTSASARRPSPSLQTPRSARRCGRSLRGCWRGTPRGGWGCSRLAGGGGPGVGWATRSCRACMAAPSSRFLSFFGTSSSIVTKTGSGARVGHQRRETAGRHTARRQLSSSRSPRQQQRHSNGCISGRTTTRPRSRRRAAAASGWRRGRVDGVGAPSQAGGADSGGAALQPWTIPH